MQFKTNKLATTPVINLSVHLAFTEKVTKQIIEVMTRMSKFWEGQLNLLKSYFVFLNFFGQQLIKFTCIANL